MEDQKDQSEYALARAAQTGNQAALETLLQKMRGPLFALAYAQTHHYDDAQDAVANALLRICRQIHTLRNPDAARSWMLQIVRNEARRLSRRVDDAPLVGEGELASGEEQILLRADIARALRTLPREQARAVSLFYLDGLPVRVIAAELSHPEGTIKYWLHQGRQGLFNQMKDYAPMTTDTTKKMPSAPAAPLAAAIISTDFSPEMLTQMTDALARAGWSAVQTRTDFADLGTRPPAVGAPAAPTSDLWNCKLLVLDEWISGRSVFEFLPLLRGRADTKNTAILLLVSGDRSPKEKEVTVLSAYVSGVDMLLNKPFVIDEFEQFARRLGDLAQE